MAINAKDTIARAQTLSCDTPDPVWIVTSDDAVSVLL